jgi:hypothetical protein
MDAREEPAAHRLATLALVCAAWLAACSAEPAADVRTSADGAKASPAPTAAGDRPLHFEERARESGIDFHMTFLEGEQGVHFRINLYDHGCGVVVGDCDGDGHDDLFFLNQLGPNALYRNRGDGTFEDVTARAGGLALADRISSAGVFADYDEDGDQDLYVTTTRGGNVLFRNRGDATFEDVTEAAGLVYVGHSQGATFFDYDGDHDLDLFVTNTANWTTDNFEEAGNYFEGKLSLYDLVDSEHEANIMYRNEGDGTFTDVTEALGLGGTGWGGDTAVFDYDEDGDPDMFVTNMFGASRLYRNDAGKRFTDVRSETLGRTSWGAIGARAFDFDTDGRLDLLVADMHSDMWIPVTFTPDLLQPWRKYPHVYGRSVEMHPEEYVEKEKVFAARLGIDYDSVVFGNTLFHNLGDGKFEEISDQAKFETFWPWGVATGDFDADGHEDVFLPSGMGFPYIYWPCSLMRNDGKGRFVNRAEAAGVGTPVTGKYLPEPIGDRSAPRSSRCAATGDFDGDGRLDLVVNNFNDHPYYYVNVSRPRHYLQLRLRGTVSNRDAIGAIARIEAGGRTQVRLVQAAGGYLSQSTKTLHFGLDDAERVERCEIRWPSGLVTVLVDVAVDQLLDVVEAEDGG